jgi:uncharacterized protein YjbJ (UPF0337 family)
MGWEAPTTEDHLVLNKDQVSGKVKEVEGRVEAAVAELKGDSTAAGREKQAEGKAQQIVGDVKKALHKAID